MIFNKIINWADERHLYEQPHVENALIRMLVEEIKEYLDGKKRGNIEEMIDALGDITVFAIGELPRLTAHPKFIFGYGDNNITIKQLIVDKNEVFNKKLSVAENLTDFTASLIGKSDEEKIDIIKNLSIGCYQTIYNMGYDPDKIMDEIYKEINSREGAFNEKHGKWMKFKTPEAMAKWYKADFSKCFLEDDNISIDK